MITAPAPTFAAIACTAALWALPAAADASSTLQTYNTGLVVSSCACASARASSSSLGAVNRAGLPSRSSSSAWPSTLAWILASLSPWVAFLTSAGTRFSRLSRSASINSVSTVSASDTGSTRPSTWVTSSSSKQRSTWTMASVSRILARNWLPSPSPFEAPRTSPAISVKPSCVSMIFCEPPIRARSVSRWSGTGTLPTFGSIVQKG